MGKTTLPVVQLTNAGELMMLNLDPVKIALYPSNTGNNIHLLRLPYIMSAFIGHGDSDKSASNNPFSRAYDELWVAGEAGADRYRKSGLDIHESQYRHVGRPQVHAISRSPRLGEEEVPTLLYAPTWEGVNLEQEYSSVSAIGRKIVSAALKSEKPVRVIYKPHPFTGQRDAKYRAVHAAIVAMIDSANASDDIAHLVVGSGAGEPSINECFNESTAMIGDISSVVTDYLASEKPYAVFNHENLDKEAFAQAYPSTAAATIIMPDGDGIGEFLEVLTQTRTDDKASARSHLAHYLLGPVEDRSIKAFQRAITTFIARSDAERAEYRTHG
ncbi:MAG: CDP-glycerol glycerophosphotransferase family protein [Propionibacteriales bacterium]|nr:CDP-glycerol glycerophosphotransferase family protein [Propionibacteriales bacterium]